MGEQTLLRRAFLAEAKRARLLAQPGERGQQDRSVWLATHSRADAPTPMTRDSRAGSSRRMSASDSSLSRSGCQPLFRSVAIGASALVPGAGLGQVGLEVFGEPLV